MCRRYLLAWLVFIFPSLFLAFWTGILLQASEGPYFITYDHHMEEPGSLEVGFAPIVGIPRLSNNFVGGWMEVEYGVKGWWTTEFYLTGQSTSNQGTVFTGFRWEHRFRPLMGEQWINPVLYMEFENVNGADKSIKEVVGHDSELDLMDPIAVTSLERKREFETKLILSSNYRGWNVSENFIAVKNITNEPWEFGYALGISRPLALAASSRECRFCRENFIAGLEFYGGLGDWHSFGLRDTSHYLAPVLAWQLGSGTTLRVSPTLGLTSISIPFMVRFSVSHEVSGFGRQVKQWFK